jgi:hypothetical protein
MKAKNRLLKTTLLAILAITSFFAYSEEIPGEGTWTWRGDIQFVSLDS